MFNYCYVNKCVNMIKTFFKLRSYSTYVGSTKRSFRVPRESFDRGGRRDVLPKILLHEETISVEAWKSVRENILNAAEYVTEKNIDSQIINFCVTHNLFKQGYNYVKYIKNANMKLNLAGIGKYFKLYHALYIHKLSTEEDDKNILLEFENLCQEYPILDSITGEYVILGLSVTKDWKKCLEILENIKISNNPNGATYNAIIVAAFRNKDFDLGWKLLQEMIEHNRVPSNEVYLTYLNQIAVTNQETKSNKLGDLLEFSLYFGLNFDEEVANKIRQINDNKPKLTFITNTGACRNCRQQLQRLYLSTSEFEKLKNEFFKSVIIGKNVFCKTTPEELERFKNFLRNMDKFDVVIDGLNVAYAAGVKHPPYVQSMLLASVVRHFVKEGKKILVCGRSHMERYPKQNWHFIKSNATVFLTDDISQDDPYMLYCCLQSGIGTAIVTRDFMRSHLFLLKDKQNKLLFSRWLAQSRYHLIHASPDKATFKAPLPYMIAAQKVGNNWHVPYTDNSNDFSKNPSYKWLCIGI